MKNLFLLSAASLFLFGCGKVYLVANDSAAEITVNGKEIPAGECAEIRVKGDFELAVKGVEGDAGKATAEGDWVWSAGSWTKLENWAKECDNNDNLVVKGTAPQEEEVTPSTTAGTGGTATGDKTNCTPSPPQVISCTKSVTAGPGAMGGHQAIKSARLITYTQNPGTGTTGNCTELAVFEAEGVKVCEDAKAKCTTEKNKWVDEQTQAGYVCSP